MHRFVQTLFAKKSNQQMATFLVTMQQEMANVCQKFTI
jgi:hypothetical protein